MHLIDADGLHAMCCDTLPLGRDVARLAVDAALASTAIQSSDAEILPAKLWHLQQLLRCLHVAMQCPNFNSLRVVSFSAAVMSLSYSTIAIGGAIAIGKQPDAYYNLDRFSTADKVRPAHILLPLSVINVSSLAACITGIYVCM